MSRSRRRPATRRPSADRAAARKFWGEAWPTDPALVRLSDDPSAMISSLGEPPLRTVGPAAHAAFVLVAAFLTAGILLFNYMKEREERLWLRLEQQPAHAAAATWSTQRSGRCSM